MTLNTGDIGYTIGVLLGEGSVFDFHLIAIFFLQKRSGWTQLVLQSNLLCGEPGDGCDPRRAPQATGHGKER